MLLRVYLVSNPSSLLEWTLSAIWLPFARPYMYGGRPGGDAVGILLFLLNSVFWGCAITYLVNRIKTKRRATNRVAPTDA